MAGLTNLYCFRAPEKRNQKIWRYMDFAKLVSLLEDRNLYLSRSDCFEDLYEGTLPHSNIEMMRQVYEGSDDSGVVAWYSFIEWTRKWTYVNCWHMNDGESYAMWKLYAQSNEAIAIQSTFNRLFANLPEDAYVGKVYYANYDTDIIQDHHRFMPYIYKRESFAHERELRVVMQDLPRSDNDFDRSQDEGPRGKIVPVNLHDLIENIYIAPTAAPWLIDLVKKVVRRYGLACEVRNSNLARPPASYQIKA